ncbi:MAG: hypothetical protein RL549_793, partial [Verrucomicrobiota bacterium]
PTRQIFLRLAGAFFLDFLAGPRAPPYEEPDSAPW